MRVYRIQVQRGDEWEVEWYPTLKEARRSAGQVEGPGYLDEVEVEAGRDALCDALNVAQANRETMDFRELERIPAGSRAETESGSPVKSGRKARR